MMVFVDDIPRESPSLTRLVDFSARIHGSHRPLCDHFWRSLGSLASILGENDWGISWSNLEACTSAG